ncbi:MAG TPA: extracellular solute-binding protein [Clostridiaceae bacterium]|nr:extracellular solute-binding protein [Clostridiaceae bacterium]
MKILSIALTLIIMVLLLASCFGDMAANPGIDTSGQKKADASGETIVLKFAAGPSHAKDDKTKKILELVERKTGYKCQTVVLPGNELDSTKKIKLSVLAGVEYDFIYSNSDTSVNYAHSKVIKPLDDLIKSTGYDVEKVFGPYIQKIDGKIYMLPELKDIHIVYYNKKIFDDAKVPYPAADWTWQDYIDIAKQLTNKEKNIFGSYFIEWTIYFSMIARQKKIPLYKPDGYSNFDDPGWAESFKFMADLGNVHKVQPDYLTYKTQKMPYDMFFQGNIGMWPAGSWVLTYVSDLKKYPRDWKIGIAPLPQINKGEKVVPGIIGGYSVLSTTKHEREAFEAIKVIAEEAYTVYTDIPCRVDLYEGDINKIAEHISSLLSFDGITPDDIRNIILDSQLEIVPENDPGPASFVIAYNLIPAYGELYCTGQKGLEDTMKELKEKADAAIKEELDSDYE